MKTTESQRKAFKEYRKRIQESDNEQAKFERNKKISFRSAKSYINNYADADGLNELTKLIEQKHLTL